jgi:phenylacetate-CoA ligase
MPPEVSRTRGHPVEVIIDELRKQGVDPRTTSLKVGSSAPKPWIDEMRAEMEAALDIDAVDIYGLSEVVGPRVANECVETKDGPHIWEDHFYPEVIDSFTREVVRDGQPGEVVLTSGTKEAMPVIRYRTREPHPPPARHRPDDAAHGQDHRPLGRLVIMRGVNLFTTQIEELILQGPDLSPNFQCVLERHGRMDEMTVRVEHRPEALAWQEAGANLARSIKNRIGVAVTVDVVPPDTIERSLVEMRRIVDLRSSAS